jgi:hypothetical protein
MGSRRPQGGQSTGGYMHIGRDSGTGERRVAGSDAEARPGAAHHPRRDQPLTVTTVVS